MNRPISNFCHRDVTVVDENLPYTPEKYSSQRGEVSERSRKEGRSSKLEGGGQCGEPGEFNQKEEGSERRGAEEGLVRGEEGEALVRAQRGRSVRGVSHRLEVSQRRGGVSQ